MLSILPIQSGQTKQVSETYFFDSLYDVPVMPGLIEVPELSLSFDKATGRISQAAAVYNGINIDAVFVFYDQSLRQMGWRKISQGGYVREGEKLSISIEAKTENNQENQSSGPLVRFLLEPE